MDYPQGTAVTVTETFMVDGEPQDPTTVTIHVVAPDGTDTEFVFGVAPNLSKPSTGVYVLVLSPSELTADPPAVYTYWGEGTGSVEAVSAPRTFRVVDAASIGTGDQGPCEPWISTSEVEPYVNGTVDQTRLQEATDAATEVLFAIVPRFPGICGPVTVRPCGSRCGLPWTLGGAGLPFWWNGGGWMYPWLGIGETEPRQQSRGCGCTPLDRVLLSGRVVEVREVKIDGTVVDPGTYELDDARYLTRLPDADGNELFWPGCQNEQLADTEAGTFSVTYMHGVQPPLIARLAARELAAGIYATTTPGADLDSCPLPSQVTKVTREGVTFDLSAFTGWGWKDGEWRTGLPLVDMFLNAFNPEGRRKRRTSLWSPDTMRAAPKLARS